MMFFVDDEGRIVDLLEDKQQINSINWNALGALCSGFINTHCHLELSHLQGEASKTGLPHFINSGQIRKASQRRKDVASS